MGDAVGDREEQQRMEALRRYQVLDTAPDERFDRITHMVSQIFRVPIAIITLIDEHRQWFKSRVGLVAPETARDIAFCNTTIAGNEVLVVEDAEDDPRFTINPLVTGPLGLRFYAGVPLQSPDGHNIGTLAIIDTKPRKMQAWERRTLLDLGRFVMSELELWRRLHELAQEHRSELSEAVARSQFERELAARRYRALVEYAPEITLLFERDGKLLYASPSLERVLGYSLPEVFGTSVVAMFIPEQGGEISTCLEQMLHHPEALHEGEWSLRHRDGHIVHVVATIQNLFANPAVSSFVMHARDVTSETHARQELERTRDLLRQAERMEAVGRFASGIAHDFNNLLTVVFNSADLAKLKIGPDDPASHDLSQVVEATQRAARLVRQILNFSEDRQPSVKRINANALVQAALPMIKRLTTDRIAIKFAPDPNAPDVKADVDQIEHVLLNLCTNARDAIADTGSITVSTLPTNVSDDLAGPHPWVQPGPHVMFAVTDTGVGMPADVAKHAFEPFFTTKPRGKGTGLGLATAYSTIRQHGGFMEITSLEGQGTQVRVFLPALPAVPDEA